VNDLNLFVLQLLIVGAVVAALVWRTNTVYRFQVCGWVLLNYVIVLRYGPVGQLEFYSNDQRHFTNVVETLVSGSFTSEFEWWLSSVRIPFTFPATVLSFVGVDPALSLKTTSLVFLLGTTHLVQGAINHAQTSRGSVITYLTAIGPVGVFFASLAQRDTSLMFFATLLVVKQSPLSRSMAVAMLLLLRPHLAASLVLGWLCVYTTRFTKPEGRWLPFRAVAIIVAGSLLGYILFSLGVMYRFDVTGYFGHQFGLRPVARIFANFVGLQFLASSSTTIEFSIAQLLIARIPFSETIIIPILFTALTVAGRHITRRSKWILWSFSIYVGLVTNTDFNSFRQNLPFMPIMGLCIVGKFQALRQSNSPSSSRGSHAET